MEKICDGKHRYQRVDAIEDAAVPGQQMTAVLHPGLSFDEALEQVAGDRCGDQNTQQRQRQFRTAPEQQVAQNRRIGRDHFWQWSNLRILSSG